MNPEVKKIRLERLNIKLNNLQKDLDKPTNTIEDFDKLIEEIKTLQIEKKDIEKKSKLDSVNKKHAEQRQILIDILKVEFPAEDIITNDGNFHAIKVKKFPSLVEFLEKHKYCHSFRFENGSFNTFKYNGETFYIREPEYQSGKDTVYNQFPSISEALKYNGILEKSMTFNKYKSLEAKILKESDRLEAEIEKSKEKIKGWEGYFLERENLINKQRPSYTTYFSI